jgi:RNA polymerase sigma factor (sigma-70 family)
MGLKAFGSTPVENFALPAIFDPPVRLPRRMKNVLAAEQTEGEQNRRISEAIKPEMARLRNFIRKHVPDGHDADDILQDVFYELIEAYRLMKPIGHVGAWLFRVARNRITDLFRKRKTEALSGAAGVSETGDVVLLEDLLPSREAGPEALFARRVLLEELEAALDELPEEQRDVFIAHEVEGRSFKELAAETGVSVNTMLSRKHYAVVHLRRRLQAIYNEFTTTSSR